MRLHIGGDRLKCFDALVMSLQIAPEFQVLRAFFRIPSRRISTRSVTAA